jgi:hypothetical protein
VRVAADLTELRLAHAAEHSIDAVVAQHAATCVVLGILLSRVRRERVHIWSDPHCGFSLIISQRGRIRGQPLVAVPDRLPRQVVEYGLELGTETATMGVRQRGQTIPHTLADAYRRHRTHLSSIRH